jgi:hypothetical protein
MCNAMYSPSNVPENSDGTVFYGILAKMAWKIACGFRKIVEFTEF